MSPRSPLDAAKALKDVWTRIAPGIDVPDKGRFLDLARAFASVEFAVPDRPDSDGLLFQYGPASWMPHREFVVKLTRQLQVVDDAGDHEYFVQCDAELVYPPDEVLAWTSGRSDWWFRDGPPFTEWLQGVEEDSFWNLLATRRAVGFTISDDTV